MRSVAKHSYIKGKNASGRAKAHVNYIQYRKGEDRENIKGGARPFFDSERKAKTGAEVKREIDAQGRSGLTHKLILSPGIQNVDLKEYTREVLGELGREKGLDLKWSAVEHRNTDHDHVHVVIMGKDKEGRQVRLDRNDYKKLRELGDRYIEREHQLERYLDRELKDLLREGSEYRREGDREFQQLIGDLVRDREQLKESDRSRPEGEEKREREERDEDEKRKEREKDGTTEREFFKLDKDLARAIRSGEIHRTLSGKQWNREMAGCLSEYHESYQMQNAKDYWTKQLESDDPAQAEGAQKILDYMAQQEAENKQDNMARWQDLDSLLGERYGQEYVLKPTDREQQERQGQEQMQRGEEQQAREQINENARIQGIGQGIEDKTDKEQERDDAEERFSRGER